MSNYPDDMNWRAFDRTWGEDEPEDNRNEDEIIEEREAREVERKMAVQNLIVAISMGIL